MEGQTLPMQAVNIARQHAPPNADIGTRLAGRLLERIHNNKHIPCAFADYPNMKGNTKRPRHTTKI